MSPHNIQELLTRCKAALWSHLEVGIGEWGLLITLFLVAFGAFGLGRLSALESAQSPVSIIQAPNLVKPVGVYIGGLYVASRTGTVYYFPWCTGGGEISPDKAVWFPTPAAARSAGYAPAKNCKGLE
jgi:hypothetical protein